MWIAGATLMSGCDSSQEDGREAVASPAPTAQPHDTLASTTAPPGPSSRSAPQGAPRIDTQKSCAAICEKSKSRGCTSDLSLCTAMCRDMTLEPECRVEIAKTLECMAALSEADWKCGDEGFPEVLSGRCEDEQQTVVQCLTIPTTK